LHDACRDFDAVNNIPRPSMCRHRAEVLNPEDEALMLDVLLAADVFTKTRDPAGRTFKAFEGISANPFGDADVLALKKYFAEKKFELVDLQHSLYSRMYRLPGAPILPPRV